MAVTQSSDSPTKNFATATPVDKNTADSLAKGNLEYTAGGTWAATGISQAPTQKTYFEFYPGDNNKQVGVNNNPSVAKFNNATYYTGSGVIAWQHNSYWNVGTNLTGKTGWTANNDVCQIAFDPANGKTWFGINNTWNDSGDPANGSNPSLTLAEGTTSGYQFFVSGNSSGTIKLNFGQDSTFGGTISAGNNPDGNGNGDFKYAPPTGFFALMQVGNPTLTIEDGSAFFQTIGEWSGNSSSQTVSQTGNSGFTPDMTIIKSRSSANGANIYDVVRGSNKGLATFDNGTEDTESDGVTFGISSGKGTLAFTGAGASGDINNSGRTYVGLTWKAGGSAGSNGNGSITSSVSAETTSGFSIVSWEGSGGNATIGHGLGVVPKMIWIRNRDTANNWVVYHVSMGNAANLHLDDETAKSTGVSLFQSTDPTTTVFSVDGSNKVNKSGDEMIAYCFADVPGFQRLGVYKGNGSTNGPFVETGFKPAFVLIRSEAVSTNTEFFSNIIEPTNIVGDQNFLNIPNAEADNDHKMDWLSNGFKIRDTSGSINASGANIIYWAIGENSFAGNTPVTAR